MFRLGHYVLWIKFDGLHDTGFHLRFYLYRVGREREPIWAEYLKALTAQGLSREP